MHDQILLSLVLNANFIDKSPSLVMAGQQPPPLKETNIQTRYPSLRHKPHRQVMDFNGYQA